MEPIGQNREGLKMSKKSKFKKYKGKYIRHLVQALFFIATVFVVIGGVSAFVFPIGGTELGIACPLGWLQITITSGLVWAITIPALILIVTALILGRYFCGWVCPLGSLIEFFDRVIGKIASPRKGKPKKDRYVKYGVFGGVLGGTLFAGFPAFCPTCPIGTLCRSSRSFRSFMIGLELLVVFPFAVGISVVSRRLWCKQLCPVGAVFGILHKVGLIQKKLPAKETCIECRKCEDACQMDIPILEDTIDKVKSDSRFSELVEEADVSESDMLRKTPKGYKEDLEPILKDHMDINSGECIVCWECQESCPVI